MHLQAQIWYHIAPILCFGEFIAVRSVYHFPFWAYYVAGSSSWVEVCSKSVLKRKLFGFVQSMQALQWRYKEQASLRGQPFK
uniref:Uncharacterized protein n=1 Tax=Rhizophora mucronata TaxID=61149 RepID=A0A2P2L8H1_RHIMU